MREYVSEGLVLVPRIVPGGTERAQMGTNTAVTESRCRPWQQKSPLAGLCEAAGQGFEPQRPVAETGVLPLDDPATVFRAERQAPSSVAMLAQGSGGSSSAGSGSLSRQPWATVQPRLIRNSRCAGVST